MDHNLRNRTIGWGLVAIQAALIGAAVLIPRDPAWEGHQWLTVIGWGLIGVAFVVGGWGALHLGSGLTPLPLPNGATDLVTRGPYRWIRHPIYTAVIMGVAGIALRSRTPAVLGVAAALGGFLWFKARWEEQHLSEAFPGYAEYTSHTGGFVPRVRRN